MPAPVCRHTQRLSSGNHHLVQTVDRLYALVTVAMARCSVPGPQTALETAEPFPGQIEVIAVRQQNGTRLIDDGFEL